MVFSSVLMSGTAIRKGALMPVKKKTLKKSKALEAVDSSSDIPMTSNDSSTPKKSKLIYIIILVIALGLLFLTNKGLLLAAVVDGRPIFRWELNKVMTSRFGKQTLENIISERLIASEAQKADIRVTQEEVNAKEEEVTKNLGENVKLEDLLKFQGMTKADFDSQIRLQMTVEKILGKDVSFTEADIDNFIATNRALLVATEPAELRKEARQTIMSQKIGEKLQPWFAELKEKAKILRFL